MTRAERAWLLAIMAAFLAWQVPLLYRTRPAQDENFYGVPGMAILKTGLPQIPYIPSRDPATIYFHADEILYTMPPLSFYLQAAVQRVLGPGLGPARMASALAGLAAVGVVFGLTKRWSGSARAALLAAAGYQFCRGLIFPATTARPDMAAVAFGLGAVWWAARDDRHWRDVGLAGVFAGLSLLCHPIGVVPSAQVGLALLLLGPAGWRRRLLEASAFGGSALLTFGLWLPMILMHPDYFRSQFGGIIFGLAVPGAGRGLLELPAVVSFQAGQFLDHVGPIQAGLYGLGLLWLAARTAREAGADRARTGRVLFHVVSGSVLLVLFMGRHHIRNYYGYPTALLTIPAAMLLDRLAAGLGRRVGDRRATAVVAVGLLLAMVPGSGLRVLAVHLGHWDDPNYRVGAFVDRVVEDLPPVSLLAVDGTYVLPIYERGLPVVEAIVEPIYFDVRPEPFDYALFGPIGLEQIRPEIEGLEFVKSYGDPSGPFGNYAELYVRVGADADSGAHSGAPAGGGVPGGGDRSGP